MKKAEILSCLCAAFVAMIGVGILVPVLPFLARHLGVGALGAGVIVAAFPFTEAVAGVLLGRVVDRRRYKQSMLLGLTLAACSYGLFAVGESFELLVVARLLAGAGSGTIVVAQAYLMRGYGEGDHVKAFGYVGAAASAGIVFGLALGAILGQDAGGAPLYREASWVAATFVIVSALMVYVHIPRDQPVRPNTGHVERPDPIIRAGTMAPLIKYGVNTLSFIGYSVVVAFVAQENFGLTVSNSALIFIIMGAFSSIVQAKFVPSLHSSFSAAWIIRTSFFTMSASLMVSLFALGNPYVFFGISVFITGSYAILVPTLLQTATTAADPSFSGKVLGLAVVSASIGSVLGPLSCGIAIDGFGISGGLASLSLAAALGLVNVRRRLYVAES